MVGRFLIYVGKKFYGFLLKRVYGVDRLVIFWCVGGVVVVIEVL